MTENTGDNSGGTPPVGETASPPPTPAAPAASQPEAAPTVNTATAPTPQAKKPPKKPGALATIGFGRIFRLKFYACILFGMLVLPPLAYNLWQAMKLAKTRNGHAIGWDKGLYFVPLVMLGMWMLLLDVLGSWIPAFHIPGATLNVTWALILTICLFTATQDIEGKLIIGVLIGLIGSIGALVVLQKTDTWDVIGALNDFFLWFGFPSEYWRGLALWVGLLGVVYMIVGTIWGQLGRALYFEGNNMIPDRLKRDLSYPWDTHRLGAEVEDWSEWAIAVAGMLGIVNIHEHGDRSDDTKLSQFAAYKLHDVPGAMLIAKIYRSLNSSENVEVVKRKAAE